MTDQMIIPLALFSLFLAYQVYTYKKKYDENLRTLEEQKQEEQKLQEKYIQMASESEANNKSQKEHIGYLNEKVKELHLKVDHLNDDKLDLSKLVEHYKEAEDQRRKAFDERIARLNTAYDQREKEKEREEAFRKEQEEQEREALKKTWLTHEQNVEEKLKVISQKHGVTYVSPNDFPHKGKPDNAVMICDEYVIFDSKSPQGDSLDHFPRYIKTQGEALKKYAKYTDVKNDIYLVVPSNTLPMITEKFMEYGQYRVYVISEESLEPILISLKRLEDYEFAERLSPDDREKIVTVIGKMAHSMKRRIQVDYFFANDFISTLTDAQNLPEDILNGAYAVEKTSKLNPPNETRKKVINNESLQKEKSKLAGSAMSQNINIDANSTDIINVPLHRED